VLVVRREDVDDHSALHEPLVLAVEVLSKSTASKDQIFKRAMYPDSVVPNFWIFDLRVPEFTAYELGDDGYHEVAHASRDEVITIEQPYPVRIRPTEIAAG